MYEASHALNPKQIDGPTQSKELSLRQNISWNLVGNTVYAGCQWGMLVALSKLTNTEMVGRFALGLAITTPIILLSQIQLRGIQATDAKDEFEFGHYLALRLLTTILALLIIAGVAVVGTYSLETALMIMAFGLSKSIESVSDVYYGVMQRYERMDRIACSRLIKGPLSLIAFSSMVYLTGDVFWGVVGHAVAWGLLLLSYDLKNARETLRESKPAWTNNQTNPKTIKPFFHRRKLLRLAWLAFPLGMVMALLSLNINIPRYFIQSHCGEGELGIFAALAYLVVAGNTVVSAMGQSVVPRLSIYYANGETNRYRKLMIRLLGVGLIMGMAGVFMAMMFGRPILNLLYRPEYANRTPILIWLMAAGGLMFVASFLGYGMTAARYFKAQLPLFVAVALTTYISSLWLIPDYALNGAVYSIMAGALVQISGSSVIIVLALGNAKKRGQPCLKN